MRRLYFALFASFPLLLLAPACDRTVAPKAPELQGRGSSVATTGGASTESFCVRITTNSIGESVTPLDAQPPAPCDSLILVIDKDGVAFWSDDRVGGGPPIRTAALDRDQLDDTLREIDKLVDWSDETLSQAQFGPNSSWTQITLAIAGRRLEMASWHELYESNGRVVATHHGLTALAGRDKDAVLAEQPAAYRQYRKTWAEIRDRLNRLLPSDANAATEDELHSLARQLRR